MGIVHQVKTVIILNDFGYINGGISQMAISCANILAERGLRVIYFSAAANPAVSPGLSPRVENYSTGQTDILRHPNRLHALRLGLWNGKVSAMMRNILEKVDPAETIIHLHAWTKALSPSIGKVITHSGIPVVYTLHDFFIACPNGGFYNYPAAKICHLKPMSLACICTNCDVRNYGHKLWRVSRQAIQRYAASIPSGIRYYISVTKFSENILRPYLPAQAEIFLLNNPVTYTLPGKPRNRATSNKMLFAGRISTEKGAALACEAARAAGVQLVVIGEGPLKTPLQEQYPEVKFRGWLSSHDLFREMLEAKALIFPSVWYETQGLIVLEALSVGLPVIVSDHCAATEFVDQRNGFTFRAGDTGDLTEKIKTLAEDPGKAAQMSRYAYDNYWKNPFLLDDYIRETLAIYSRILEKEKTSKHKS